MLETLPDVFVDDFSRLTLADLRKIKADYLARGLAAFDDLVLIVTTFGSQVEIRHRVYTVWQHGNITALYSVEQGAYLPGESRFQETERLSIFLDLYGLKDLDNPRRKQVCYLQHGDSVIEDDQCFIPGQWLMDMLGETMAAEAVDRQMAENRRQAEREALIRELMLGVAV